MKDMDFREGDEVTYVEDHMICYHGTVKKIDTRSRFPVIATFPKITTERFTIEGKYHGDDSARSLFHGHVAPILEPNEILPIREAIKWVNVWGVNGISYSKLFDTKEEAERFMKSYININFIIKAAEVSP